MNTSILSLVLFLIASFACFGQRFEKGHVITNNGEQINGLISIQSNYLNSRTCLFRDVDKGTLESFTPDDIKSYRTQDKYYTSREVEIDSVKQKLFLEFLVDGIVDLYYLRDGANEYYFIEKENSLYQLQNNEIQVYIEGDGVIESNKVYSKNSNQYKGALNYLFSDGKGLNEEIANTPFNYRSLINVTKDYHNAVCNEYECIDYTRSSVQKMRLEISPGIDYSQLRYQTSHDHGDNIRPAITAQLRLEPLKSNTRWIFLIGLSVSANNYHGNFKQHIFEYSNQITVEIIEKFINLKLPLNFQYEFGSGKFKPLVFAGYSACYYLSLKYEGYKVSNIVHIPQPGNVKKYNHGFTAGTGFNYEIKEGNYLFVKTIYEYRVPSANVNDIYDYSRNQSFIFNFGYAFSFKKN